MTNMAPKCSSISWILICFLLAESFFMGVSYGAESSTNIYIVYMGEKKHEDPELVTASHHSLLISLLGSKEEALGSMVYSYRHGFSGFSAMLTEVQARKLRESAEVISVEQRVVHKMHTTNSWDFLGLPQNEPVTGLLKKTNYGDGVIIGVIDTGIWPESRSFSAEGYGPVPSRWKGVCQTGQAFSLNNCSSKIIGARWYSSGVDPELLKKDYLSARDSDGHGTHMASTAAGNFVPNVSFNGLAAGTVRGGAPRARLAVYKACWGGTCNGDAVLKAIDDAIHDGVDVLSISIWANGYPAGTIKAVARGINVIFSGGNNGPSPLTVVNDVPWGVMVAATTVDRSFDTVITLGNNQRVVGQSIYTGIETNFTMLISIDDCNAESLNDTSFADKFVFCYFPYFEQDLGVVITNIQKVKAKGLIFAADHTTNRLEILYACGGTPCVLVDSTIVYVIRAYSKSVSTPVVKVSPCHNAIGTTVLAPKVAAFSSRGPSPIFPKLLKPDIAAPGVSILAAYMNSYKFASGTSVACSHVSGVVALLKSLHPNWSPAAIKSAIITTASVADGFGLPIKAEGPPTKIADPFDYGGGQIAPSKAADPGLIYDVNPNDYFEFFNCTQQASVNCGSEARPLYLLNLPSIAIPELHTSITVLRTVTNVGKVDAVYKAAVQSPPGVTTTVVPSVLEFNTKKRVHTFAVTFHAQHRVQGDYRFGSLIWEDGGLHFVKIPIAVRVVIQDFYADTA